MGALLRKLELHTQEFSSTSDPAVPGRDTLGTADLGTRTASPSSACRPVDHTARHSHRAQCPAHLSTLMLGQLSSNAHSPRRTTGSSACLPGLSAPSSSISPRTPTHGAHPRRRGLHGRPPPAHSPWRSAVAHQCALSCLNRRVRPCGNRQALYRRHPPR